MCPDLGEVRVAAPPAIGVQPALPDRGLLQVQISYTAVDLRSGATVRAGGPAPSTSIDCGTPAFADQPAAQVSQGPRPAGVAATDRLSGHYSVAVRVLALPAAPGPLSATAVRPFPVDAQLGSYLADRPGNKSVAMFDAATSATYAFAPTSRFVTASIVKVAILGTVLRNASRAGRFLTSTETTLATRMIEVSDNSAATALWNEIGGGPGLAQFISAVGMTSTTPGPDGYWGLTQTTTPDQLLLLRTVSYPNAVLTPNSRAYALSLMTHVASDQRWGVSAAAPAGATVAIKNGWLPRTGGWAINSIGRISGGGREFVLAELTFGSPAMSTGVSTVEAAARIVAGGLPHTPIGDHYVALGGPNGFLGNPTTAQLVTPDGIGAFTVYQFGSIYWAPRTGAHEVHGAIRDTWASFSWERGVLGYPLTDETVTPDGIGRFNHFQRGSIYWTPTTGAHEVHGAIRDAWARLGWERSALGYPVSDEFSFGDGRRSNFQHGYVQWHAATGTVDVVVT